MNKLRQYLYRVLGTDDDGDPLDFGVVQAESSYGAARIVSQHLAALGWDPGVTHGARIYRIDPSDSAQVLDSPSGYEHYTLVVP